MRYTLFLVLLQGILHGQIKLQGTFSYEKEISEFPEGIAKITTNTPVLLKHPEKPKEIFETISDVAVISKEPVDESSTPVKAALKPVKPSLIPEQYWLRKKPGVLIPVKIAGSILHFNGSDIYSWDYNQYILTKHSYSQGKFKKTSSDTIRSVSKDCYMHSRMKPDSAVIFINEISTKEKSENADHLDFYDTILQRVASYSNVLKANAEIFFLNADSMIIAEFANAEKKVHLSLFSLKKGVLQSRMVETDWKVSSLPTHFLEVNNNGNIILVYNIYDKRGAQILVFDSGFRSTGKCDLDDYVSYAGLLKDSPILLLSYTGSAMGGGAKYQKVDLASLKVSETILLSDVYGTSSSQWKVFLPFQEKKLDSGKAVGLLSMFYSPLQAFPEKRKLLIVEPEKTSKLDLIPVPNKEFITLPLAGRQLAVYRGTQVKIYGY